MPTSHTLEQLLSTHHTTGGSVQETNSKIIENKSCQTSLSPICLSPPPHPKPVFQPPPPPQDHHHMLPLYDHPPCHPCCQTRHHFDSIPSFSHHPPQRIPTSYRTNSHRSTSNRSQQKQASINHQNFQRYLFEKSPKYSKTIKKIYEDSEKTPFETPPKNQRFPSFPNKSKKYRDLSYLSSDWTSTPSKEQQTTTTTPYTTTTTSTPGTKSGVEYKTSSSMDDCQNWRMKSSTTESKGTTTISGTTTFLTTTTTGNTGEEGVEPLDYGFEGSLVYGNLSDGEVLSLGEIRDMVNAC